MQQDRIRNRKVGRSLLVRATLGAAVAAAVLCANSAVRAGDDDEDGASVVNRLMQSLGIKSAPDHSWDGINYSERSPLVVPPTRDLPPPVSGSSPPVANWPKDPVEQRAKTEKDDRARYQKDNVLESQRPLSPGELNVPGASRSSDQGSPGASADAGYGDPRGTSVDQRDQGAKKGMFSSFSNMFKKEEYATFTGEPARETLTDPPPGYLTPSADQPYGFGQKVQPYKVPTVGDRMEPTR
jgi:hypothetical protein